MLNKKAIIILSSMFLLAGCSSDVAKENKTNVSNEQSSKETGEQNRLKKYSKNIQGGEFIKKSSIKDNAISIEYYKDYKEYRSYNSKSKVSEVLHLAYMNMDRVKEILFIENVRLLREFPDAKSSEIKIYYKDKEYYVKVKREEINKYLGINVEKLKANDESWEKEFISKYSTKEEIEKFYNKFVKESEAK